MSQTDRTHELIQKYFEALSTEDEIVELEQLLTSDPAAAANFAEAARLHANLQNLFQNQYKINQVAELLDSSPAIAVPLASSPAGNAEKTAPHRDHLVHEDRTASLSDSAFIPIPRHLIGTRRERFRFTVPVLRWRRVAVAALALMMAIGAWTWFGPVAPRPQLVAGIVSIAGREVAEIPDNVEFDVRGKSAAISFPDGSQVELHDGARARIRRSGSRFVVHLHNGGGDFQVPSQNPELTVETALGRVATPGGRFTLDFVTSLPPQLSPAEHQRLPRLAVTVALGSVQVAHAGTILTLSAGEQHIFFNPT